MERREFVRLSAAASAASLGIGNLFAADESSEPDRFREIMHEISLGLLCVHDRTWSGAKPGTLQLIGATLYLHELWLVRWDYRPQGHGAELRRRDMRSLLSKTFRYRPLGPRRMPRRFTFSQPMLIETALSERQS